MVIACQIKYLFNQIFIYLFNKKNYFTINIWLEHIKQLI